MPIACSCRVISLADFEKAAARNAPQSMTCHQSIKRAAIAAFREARGYGRETSGRDCGLCIAMMIDIYERSLKP